MKSKLGLIILIILIALVITGCKDLKPSRINFVVDGGVAYSLHFNSGEEIALPDEPTKEGYEFLGWYVSESFDGEPITNNSFIGAELPEIITVYAKWKSIANNNDSTYTITFDSNGGSSINALAKTAGENITPPDEPTKTGFIFDGWYADNNTFNSRYTFTAMPEENITLYAKWKSASIESIYDLRFETDETFEVNSFKSVRYNFDITDFLLLEILIVSDNLFNAVLIGSESEIISYQTDRVSDRLLLENGDYSLVITKHEQDTIVTTNIAHQEIIEDGEVRLNEENPLRLLRFDITEEYNYILVLSILSDDILYNVYDEYSTLLYENQQPGTAHYFETGEYYFLFHNEDEYSGKAIIAKKSQATNTSRENAEPLNGIATGQIDVSGTQLYYSFTVDADGSLILVHAFAEDNKHIQVQVTDANDKAVVRAGLTSATNPSSLPMFDNEAKGEYVLPQGTYYLRVNLGTGLTGSFNVSAEVPNITNTYVGATHSFYVNPNTNYYFKVYVEEKTRIYFNIYSEDKYFPFYSETKEENGIKYYTRAYSASMFTDENYFYAGDGNMQLGGSSSNSNITGNVTLADGYTDKSDTYYVCIRAYANAEGGDVLLRVERNTPS